MFQSARIKLTLWYVLIIMIITGLFSLAAYQNLSQELARSFRAFRRIQIQAPFFDPGAIPFDVDSDQALFDEARTRLAMELGFTNLVILLISGAASYVLAGKTLAPIEKMMEEQKQFVSDASHELRTPLTVMKTEIEVALREKSIGQDEARLMLKSNLEEVEKIQALSNYLLSLNRYQSDKVTLPMMSVNIKNIIKKAISQVGQKAKAKKIRIIDSSTANNVLGNEVGLVELMVIFVDNAIKYSPEKSLIKINTLAENRWLTVEIEDQGIGIRNEDMPRLFDRFFRADTSRSKIKAEGYGLGLSIAKNIVDLHHGKIEVKSMEGKGSVFRIILPTA